MTEISFQHDPGDETVGLYPAHIMYIYHGDSTFEVILTDAELAQMHQSLEDFLREEDYYGD